MFGWSPAARQFFRLYLPFSAAYLNLKSVLYQEINKPEFVCSNPVRFYPAGRQLQGSEQYLEKFLKIHTKSEHFPAILMLQYWGQTGFIAGFIGSEVGRTVPSSPIPTVVAPMTANIIFCVYWFRWLWPHCVADADIIFLPWFFLSFFFFFLA